MIDNIIFPLKEKDTSFLKWIKNNRKKIAIVSIITLVVIVFFMFQSRTVFAKEIASESDIGKVLLEHSDFFKKRNMWSDIVRIPGWWLMKFLFQVVYGLEMLLTQALDFFGFVTFMKDNSIYTELLSLVIAALMAGTLIWIGAKMILNQGEVPQFKSIAQNTIVAFILIIGMPFLMSWLQDGVRIVWGEPTIVTEEVGSVDNEVVIERLSIKPLKNNFVDLFIPFQSFENVSEIDDWLNQAEENQVEKNSITDPDSTKYMSGGEFFKAPKDIPEELSKGDSKEILTHQIVVQPDVETPGVDVKYVEEFDKDGLFSKLTPGNLLETGYYRYQWDFIPIVVTLGALAIAFVYTIFSIITIYIEMAFKLIASPVVLATDLETGQKTKKVLHDIITGFLTVAFEIIAFQIYIEFYRWLGDNQANFHWLVYLFAIVAGTLSLITGSQTILSWFGVDLGLNEGRRGFASFMALSGIGKLSRWGLGKLSNVGKKETDKARGKESGSSTERESLNNESEDIEEIPTPPDMEDVQTSSSLQSISRGIGYAKARGIKGLGKDGLEKGSETIGGAVDATKTGIERGIDAVADKTVRPAKEAIDGAISAYDEGQLNAISQNEIDSSEKATTEIEETETVDKNREVNVHEEEQIDGATSSEAIPDSSEQIRQINESLNEVDFAEPEEAVRQVSEQVNKAGLDEATSQKIKQELEEATTMQPDQAEQHIRQVLDEAQSSIEPTTGTQKVNLEGQVQSATTNVKAELPTAPVSQVSSVTMKPIAQSARQLSNVSGDTVQAKTQTIKQQVLESAKQPETVEQTVKRVVQDSSNQLPQSVQKDVTQRVRAIREEANKSNLSDEVVKQRIEREISGSISGSNIPQSTQQTIIQNVQEAAVGNTKGTQRVVQQIENASIATPSQLQRNVSRAFSNSFAEANTRIPSAVTQEVQQILKESKSLPPKEATQKVVQQVEKMDFGGQEGLKEKVIDKVKNAHIVNEEQLQANLKTIQKNEKENTLKKLV